MEVETVWPLAWDQFSHIYANTIGTCEARPLTLNLSIVNLFNSQRSNRAQAAPPDGTQAQPLQLTAGRNRCVFPVTSTARHLIFGG